MKNDENALKESLLQCDNCDGSSSGDEPTERSISSAEKGNAPESSDETNAILLLKDLEEQLECAKRRYYRGRRIKIILMVLFIVFWLIAVPLALGEAEDWTYQSAWYYSVQAGFGVGYGAISPTSSGIEVLLTFHIFFGSLFIAFLVSTYVTDAIEKNEENGQESDSSNNIGKKSLGQQELGLRSFFIAVGLYLLVIIAGVMYGIIREDWNLTESLLFIFSTCQTSGLVAPDIKPKKDDAIFNPVFVMFLVIVGVPLWAYGVGKLSMILVYHEANKKNLFTVMDRRRKARTALLRIEETIKKENNQGVEEERSLFGHDRYYHVDRFGFLAFWLLEQRAQDERTILDLMREFELLKRSGQCDPTMSDSLQQSERDDSNKEEMGLISRTKSDETVPLWKISARLQFLQLVELKLVNAAEWPRFLNNMERVERSNTLHSNELIHC